MPRISSLLYTHFEWGGRPHSKTEWGDADSIAASRMAPALPRSATSRRDTHQFECGAAFGRPTHMGRRRLRRRRPMWVLTFKWVGVDFNGWRGLLTIGGG